MPFLKRKLNNKDGIYNLEITDSSTKKVTEFYKITPFPNYKNDENKQTILDKGDLSSASRHRRPPKASTAIFSPVESHGNT